jgi:hypothetical protein
MSATLTRILPLMHRRTIVTALAAALLSVAVSEQAPAPPAALTQMLDAVIIGPIADLEKALDASPTRTSHRASEAVTRECGVGFCFYNLPGHSKKWPAPSIRLLSRQKKEAAISWRPRPSSSLETAIGYKFPWGCPLLRGGKARRAVGNAILIGRS